MGLVEGAWQVCNERAASRTREAALMKRVSFHELAERELNDAALYYEQENAGLGFKFLEEVERYIGAINLPLEHAEKRWLSSKIIMRTRGGRARRP